MADDEMFQQQADQTHAGGGKKHRGNEGDTLGGCEPSEIGAEGEHSPMPHIDDAHQTENDRKPERGERKDEGDQHRIDKHAEGGLHLFFYVLFSSAGYIFRLWKPFSAPSATLRIPPLKRQFL